MLDMAIGAASGLAYLESKNVIHRDIALRNLLVTRADGKYVVKVADFGLSRSTQSGEYESSSGSKLPIKWTAVEVLTGGKFTSKSDVWSYGIALWEIFSFGEEPYTWLSNKEVCTEVPKGERLPRPAKCPNNIYKFMRRCWADDPQDRPTFAEIVKELKSMPIQEETTDKKEGQYYSTPNSKSTEPEPSISNESSTTYHNASDDNHTTNFHLTQML